MYRDGNEAIIGNAEVDVWPRKLVRSSAVAFEAFLCNLFHWLNPNRWSFFRPAVNAKHEAENTED